MKIQPLAFHEAICCFVGSNRKNLRKYTSAIIPFPAILVIVNVGLPPAISHCSCPWCCTGRGRGNLLHGQLPVSHVLPVQLHPQKPGGDSGHVEVGHLIVHIHPFLVLCHHCALGVGVVVDGCVGRHLPQCCMFQAAQNVLGKRGIHDTGIWVAPKPSPKPAAEGISSWESTLCLLLLPGSRIPRGPPWLSRHLEQTGPAGRQ